MPGDYASLNESSVAGTVAAEYVGSERMKFSTRLEARRATLAGQLSHTAAVAYKPSPDWTPAAAQRRAAGQGPRRQRRRRHPAAPADRRGLPPGGQRPLHFLTRYEHRAERLSGAASTWPARPAAWTASSSPMDCARTRTSSRPTPTGNRSATDAVGPLRLQVDHRRIQRTVVEELGPSGLRSRHVGPGPALGRRRAGLRHDRQGGARQTGFGVKPATW